MFAITHLLLALVSLSAHLCGADKVSTLSSARLNLTCGEVCEHARDEAQNQYFVHEFNETKQVPVALKPVRTMDRQDAASPDPSQTSNRHPGASSIIFGLSKIASEAYLNEQCFSDFKSIERGIIQREPWAMKVLDASGTKVPGFIWGHNYWLGSREACSTVQRPVKLTLSSQFKRNMKEGIIKQMAPFGMDYRVVYVKHNSPWQVEVHFMTERLILVGLCLPSSCSSPEIQNLTQTLLDEGGIEDGDIYDLQPEVMHIKDLKLKDSFFDMPSLKFVIGVLVFTLVMMVAARFLTDDEAANNKKEPSPADGTFSGLVTFVKCFDIPSNARALYAIKETAANSIPVINGLRSVCCCWVLMFHVLWYMYFTVNNKVFLLSYSEQMFYQYVATTPLLVDLFFTISGFLQTYNFIKNEKRLEAIRRGSLVDNAKEFGRMLFHRYLRLAPLYLVLMGVGEVFTAYSEDVSVFHIHDRHDLVCEEHWWRNIIFIQSFFKHEELCLNWTWSLSCEMVYFCLISVLMFVYTKHPRTVKNILGGLLVGSILWTFYVGLSDGFQLSFDVAYHVGTQIYISPYVRIMTYMIGAISGLWLAANKCQFEMGATTEKWIWNIIGIVFWFCMYSTSNRDMSSLSATALYVFGRMYMSVAGCWVIAGSATGRGTWWSRVLEHKLFQHFNRLTYAIYLLNPFVISVVYNLSKTSSVLDPLQVSVMTCGFIVVVYLASVPFSLAFEMPYCNWSSALTKNSKKLKAA